MATFIVCARSSIKDFLNRKVQHANQNRRWSDALGVGSLALACLQNATKQVRHEVVGIVDGLVGAPLVDL